MSFARFLLKHPALSETKAYVNCFLGDLLAYRKPRDSCLYLRVIIIFNIIIMIVVVNIIIVVRIRIIIVINIIL